MPNHLSAEMEDAGSGTLPQAQPDSALVTGKVRRLRASFTLDAQADADTLEIGNLPIGAAFAGVRMTAGASLGTSTIAIGIAGSTAKYKAAGTFTAVDTPTTYGKASALDDVPLAAEETVIATIATAALPDTGEPLVFEFFYTTRA